jgi:hypothetical protein
MKKIIIMGLLACIACSSVPAGANQPEIEKYTVVPVDDIKLRDPLQLEQAGMEYMLAYEAWLEARRSKDPEARANIVRLMKEYREAYARFLAMLREDKLYEPQKPKNPAGWYNQNTKEQKVENVTGKERMGAKQENR